ncbi:MAG: pyridoxal-phosphate-dependent aminotransferase family protein [Paracoccaceae bacterium]
MSLSHGRGYLAIPGPSVMPESVLRAMQRPAPNIYEGEIVGVTETITRDLKYVARTQHDVAMYICNGHGVWEAALANTLRAGETVLVAATGRFGHGWADVARGQGMDVQIAEFGKSSPLDPAAVGAALRADTSRKIKAVLVSHVDTSGGILNDIPALRAAMDDTGHPALLMADCVASMGCDRFEMDAWGVDVAVSASQKGLMTPPGMGIVWFGPKAAAARAALDNVPRYWDWAKRARPAMYYEYWGGTAPTHHVFALRAALDLMVEEGIEAIWARHDRLARAIWAACDAWGQGGSLRFNMPDPAYRSRAVTALSLAAPDATRLRNWVEEKTGVTLGIGLGMAEPGSPEADGFFRIGHMGHLNAHMVMGMLGVVQSAFVALDIAHGAGGMDAATQVMAKA